MERTDRPAWIDALLACLLACVLGGAWAWRDWANLSALRLPDADDMMRLQQIRDWLGGQAFGDLMQYRLGPTGTPMHWTRLDDLVPAAIIRGLEGVIGRHGAEVAAVIAWPTMLLAAAMVLTGRLARIVGGVETVLPATIVAAIAYPVSTLFVPGRIDHHNLQMVLVLILALALTVPGTIRAGALAGIAAALSLVVGMETAPLLAAATLVLVLDWIGGSAVARTRLLGFGLALAAGMLASAWLFGARAFGMAACDGFTSIAVRAAMIASLLPIGLALVRLRDLRWRVAAAGVGGVLVLGAIALWAPQCLSPYGGVDPLLQRLWLARVGEAVPLLRAPFAVAVGYTGLMLAGIVAGLWQFWRTGGRGWAVLLALQIASFAVALMQIRGAYPGALLAAPALGMLIVVARRHGSLALAGAWIASAGMLYPIAAQALIPATASPGASCTSPALIAALKGLPTGTVLAPMDTGGPAIAATSHRLIAGAYHRDNAGNLAMYRFYLGPVSDAPVIAARLNATYVVACDGFAGRPPQTSLANQLAHGSPPAWLERMIATPDNAILYRVRSSLPVQSAAR